MPKIKRAVENVTVESKKINYDPTKDTNWCHLPMEMRMECIQKMDFRTRIRLSGTSITEKLLVESKKYHFDRVSIRTNGGGMDITARNMMRKGETKEIEVKSRKSREKSLECALKVLKTCNIKSFNYDFNEEVEQFEKFVSSDVQFLAKYAPFGFKRFTTSSENLSSIRFFLKNCGNLERITFRNCLSSKFPLGGVLETPSIINTKDLRFDECKMLEPPWTLIEKWIENDAEVGKCLQFKSDGESIDSFAAKFADRLIENKNNEVIRIRTDNESKEIILKQIGFIPWHLGFYSSDDDYMFCKVIPVGLAETEYSTGSSWINNTFVRHYYAERHSWQQWQGDSDESACDDYDGYGDSSS